MVSALFSSSYSLDSNGGSGTGDGGDSNGGGVSGGGDSSGGSKIKTIK